MFSGERSSGPGCQYIVRKDMSRPPPPQFSPAEVEGGNAFSAAALLGALPDVADAGKYRTIQVGQRVSAWFFGEWHPAVVRRCEERAVEVRWESEATVSVLPMDHVRPLAFASPPDSATAETREASGSISSLDFMSSAASTSPEVSLTRDEIRALKVGDEVSASFYGEWHPAVVRKLEGDIVEVLWKSELTVSRLPQYEVRSLSRSAPTICHLNCQASDDNGETRKQFPSTGSVAEPAAALSPHVTVRNCANIGSGQALDDNGSDIGSVLAERFVSEPARGSLPHSKVRSGAGSENHGIHGRSIGEPSLAMLEQESMVAQVSHGSVQKDSLNRFAEGARPAERKHPAGAAIGDFKHKDKPRTQREEPVVATPGSPSKWRHRRAEHLAEHQVDRQKKPQATKVEIKQPPASKKHAKATVAAKSPTSHISSTCWADAFDVSEEEEVEEEEEEAKDDQDGHVELDTGKEVRLGVEGEENDDEQNNEEDAMQSATAKDKRKARQQKKKKAKALEDDDFNKCLEEFGVA